MLTLIDLHDSLEQDHVRKPYTLIGLEFWILEEVL